MHIINYEHSNNKSLNKKFIITLHKNIVIFEQNMIMISQIKLFTFLGIF